MAKQNTAATATATTAVVAEKAPSRMAQAKELYAEVFSKGYDLNGQSQRQNFIARSQAEIGLTPAGANTYFQNISNEAKGEGLYKYNRTPKKSDEAIAGDLPTIGKKPTKREVAAAEKAAAANAIDLNKRFHVKSGKKVVETYATKPAAEKNAAKGEGLVVVDTKAAASN